MDLSCWTKRTSRSASFGRRGPADRTSTRCRRRSSCASTSATSSLPDDVKERLRNLAGNRMISDDILLIDSREHRTQAQNREAARARLSALLEHAAQRPKKTTADEAEARRARKTARIEEAPRRAVKQLRGRSRARRQIADAGRRDRLCQVARRRAIREDRFMLWIALGAVGIGGALFVYRAIRPMMRRRRKYDAGAVSEYWIEQQRGRSQDASR